MLFSVIGMNFVKTPVETRELFCFPDKDIIKSLLDFSQKFTNHSAVILSTCNRVEIYSDIIDLEKVLIWWAEYKNQKVDCLNHQVYFKTGRDALKHLIEVGSGVNSMVLGENQILGQVKSAYQNSLQVKMINLNLRQCFDQAFHSIKKIKSLTELSSCQVSVASIAVSQALQYDQERHLKYLIVGAGQTGELILRYLHQHRQDNVMLTNRSTTKGIALAEKYGVGFVPYNQIEDIIPLSDVIFCATSSPKPILRANFFNLKHNCYKKWHIFDLAVPLNTDKKLHTQNNIVLTTIDALEEISTKNNLHRQYQIKQARLCIAKDLENFHEKILQQNSVYEVKNYLHSCHLARDELVNRALMKLNKGIPAQEVIEQLAYKLTQKITHIPIKVLKTQKNRDTTNTKS